MGKTKVKNKLQKKTNIKRVRYKTFPKYCSQHEVPVKGKDDEFIAATRGVIRTRISRREDIAVTAAGAAASPAPEPVQMQTPASKKSIMEPCISLLTSVSESSFTDSNRSSVGRSVRLTQPVLDAGQATPIPHAFSADQRSLHFQTPVAVTSTPAPDSSSSESSFAAYSSHSNIRRNLNPVLAANDTTTAVTTGVRSKNTTVPQSPTRSCRNMDDQLSGSDSDNPNRDAPSHSAFPHWGLRDLERAMEDIARIQQLISHYVVIACKNNPQNNPPSGRPLTHVQRTSHILHQQCS